MTSILSRNFTRAHLRQQKHFHLLSIDISSAWVREVKRCLPPSRWPIQFTSLSWTSVILYSCFKNSSFPAIRRSTAKTQKEIRAKEELHVLVSEEHKWKNRMPHKTTTCWMGGCKYWPSWTVRMAKIYTVAKNEKQWILYNATSLSPTWVFILAFWIWLKKSALVKNVSPEFLLQEQNISSEYSNPVI